MVFLDLLYMGKQKYFCLFSEIPRPRKRLTELLIKTALDEPAEKDRSRWENASKEWALKFLRSPVEFLADDSGSRVGSVKFAVNRLEVNEGEIGAIMFFRGALYMLSSCFFLQGPIKSQHAVQTEATETVPCGLVSKFILVL